MSSIMFLNRLYRHEKVLEINLEPPLLQAILAYLLHIVPLRWFASTIPQCTHDFVPGYLLGQTSMTMRKIKVSMTTSRTRPFSRSAACRV
jgi:hypothetical protein